MIQDEELKSEWYEEMRMEAKQEEYMECKLRNDIDYLREHLEDVICEANELLDTIGKELEHYGYDSSDNDVLEFIRG